MNKTKIRETALAILNGTLAKRKRNPIGFNLARYFSRKPGYQDWTDHTGHNCDTVACIAGWVHFLNGGKNHQAGEIALHARKVLGLSINVADELFAPQLVCRDNVTTAEAALVLFKLAETGKVDWKVARA